MSYHEFISEDGTRCGSFEVFYLDAGTIAAESLTDEEGTPLEPGFYWWACFPGCLPDGEPSGPYQTEEEAIEDANSR
jgi:hypothetical protein